MTVLHIVSMTVLCDEWLWYVIDCACDCACGTQWLWYVNDCDVWMTVMCAMTVICVCTCTYIDVYATISVSGPARRRVRYRVAETKRMPYLYRVLLATEPYNQLLLCEETPAAVPTTCPTDCEQGVSSFSPLFVRSDITLFCDRTWFGLDCPIANQTSFWKVRCEMGRLVMTSHLRWHVV